MTQPTNVDRLSQLLERPTLVARGDVVNLQMLLHKIGSDAEQDNAIRDDAAYWVSVLDELLVHGSPSPERWIAIVPAGLKIAHNYTIILDMLEAELSDDVKAEMPGQLAMARTMAEGADNTSFCTDYRLDCVSALEKLLISIQNESDETQEV